MGVEGFIRQNRQNGYSVLIAFRWFDMSCMLETKTVLSLFLKQSLDGDPLTTLIEGGFW